MVSSALLIKEELEELLIADCKKILICILQLDMEPAEISFVREKLESKTKVEGITHYITGQSIIEDDVFVSAEESLATIEYLTIGLIFIVLLVFSVPL